MREATSLALTQLKQLRKEKDQAVQKEKNTVIQLRKDLKDAQQKQQQQAEMHKEELQQLKWQVQVQQIEKKELESHYYQVRDDLPRFIKTQVLACKNELAAEFKKRRRNNDFIHYLRGKKVYFEEEEKNWVWNNSLHDANIERDVKKKVSKLQKSH